MERDEMNSNEMESDGPESAVATNATADPADSAEEFVEPKMTRSDRDIVETESRLAAWLRTKLAPDADPVIDSLVTPEKNGMSSETLLIDATWTENGERSVHRLVARLEPPATAVPVFPDYFLDRQFESMRLVGELCSAPIPQTYWFESDRSAVGAPFFVMERLDGDVPPDVMPYAMGSWVTEATEEQRNKLATSTVDVLAEIHGIDDAPVRFGFLHPDPAPGVSPLRAHVDGQYAYYRWMTDESIPVIDEAFAWLEANWPASEPEPRLSWGDSRVGNVMYREFEPVAILDWEMASVAPREVDVAWLIFMHRFFEDLCIAFGLDGLPHMLRRADVEERYQHVSGYQLQDMDWYLAYAALRHAIVMHRVKQRAIHFGEDTMPDTPDGMILHAPVLRAMISGKYWSELPPEVRYP